MLMPKKTKFRKKMKGNMKGTETRGCALELGQYGLQALEPAWITSRQIVYVNLGVTLDAEKLAELQKALGNEVVAVGPGGVVDGKEITMQVKVGDKVIYSKYAGTEVKLEDEEYIVVKQNDILAIVE